MNYEVGKYYTVKCAVVQRPFIRSWDNKINKKIDLLTIPIIGKPHRDTGLGVSIEHYHIDGRFISKNNGFTIITPEGKTNHVIDKSWIAAIVEKRLKCKRNSTGMDIKYAGSTFALNPLYSDWYATYMGKKIKNNKCPHYGMEMIREGDKLRCPLHDLHGCPISNTIIQHPVIADNEKYRGWEPTTEPWNNGNPVINNPD